MKHGGNVWQGQAPGQYLDFSANLRPEGMPEWVREALLAGMEEARYYPDPQMRRAARAMAQYLGLPHSHVRPTAGGISAIQMVNCLETSQTLLCTPCFCEYEQFAAGPVRKVSLLRDRHRIGLPDDLHLQPNSLVWFCNPMNPVGHAFGREEIKALLAQVEAANSYLAVDEAFIEYCPQHSAAGLIEDHEHLLVTGSLTKILGIPGVRLGYLCAQPQILEKLRLRQLTWELSCFAGAVACALPDHKREIQADSARNARRREQFAQDLENLGVYVYPSQSACLLADFGRPVEPLVQKLKEQNILVRSCMSFDDINDGCHLRLAVKDEDSNRRLLQALKEVLLCAENH